MMTRQIPNTGSPRPLSFTRRNLIRSSLAATVLFPLLEAGRAQAASTFPTRLLIVTTPNGTRDKLFWPKGTETNFQLNTLTTPLEPFKNRLTFLKGIKLNDALQNGALGGTLGSEHARGSRRHASGPVLAAPQVPAVSGPFQSPHPSGHPAWNGAG
ncbi:MAG: DUF1552 domain-containing protein, partial [Moraxellaceae bacterium]